MLFIFSFIFFILGCESVGNAIISSVPTLTKDPPLPIEKKFEIQALEMEPGPNRSIIYAYTEGKLNGCAGVDYWMDDIYIGRVLSSTYIYYPANPGSYTIKLQDDRINKSRREIDRHTTSFKLKVEPGKKYFIHLYPVMKKCSLKKISAIKVYETQGQLAFDFPGKRTLSRLNEFDAKERGMWNTKIDGKRTLVNQFEKEDKCNGRETPNIRPLPNLIYKCSYERLDIAIIKQPEYRTKK